MEAILEVDEAVVLLKENFWTFKDKVRSFGVKRRVRDRSIQTGREGAEMGEKLNIYR